MVVDEFGKLLKKLRGNMSLREASERTGVSFSYIGYLETGKHPRTGMPIKPSPEMLKGLSKGYSYPYKDLMIAAGYSYDASEDPSLQDTELEKEQKYVASLFDKITDPVEKEKAISYLKDYAPHLCKKSKSLWTEINR